MNQSFFSRISLKTTIISQIIAILIHTYLTNIHYSLKFGLLEGKSLCNISDFLNCDVVNASSYAVLFSAPLALWGLLSNFCLLIVIFLYLVSENKTLFRQLSQFGAALISITSIVMAFISFTKINSLCIFCLIAYFFSFLTLAFTYFLPKSQTEKSDRFIALIKSPTGLKTITSIAIGLPLSVFLVNAVVMNNFAQGADKAIASSLQDWKTGTDIDLSSAKGLQKGAPLSNAKMVIVEFADFQCIHCKHAQPVLSSFVRSRPDVTLIYQSFPLDGNCNAVIERKGDGKSCDLAKSVWCGLQQDKGWQLHDWAFENFGRADLGELAIYAEKIGINMDLFRQCRESNEALQAVLDQAKLGEKAGVKGTPSIYVNGRMLPRGGSLMVLEAAYNELVK